MASFVRLVTCPALVMLGLSSCDGRRTPAKRAVQCTVTDGVTIAGSGVEMLAGPPLRWVSRRDGHAYESAGDPMRPLDLGPAQALGGEQWDDAFWYRIICFEGCGSSLGPRYGVERIDKRTGEKVRLGVGEPGEERMILFGDYVYWGRWGDDYDGGGVRRVRRGGGPQESIHIWKKRDDYIQSLIPYPGRGILVIGRSSVAWIPGMEDKGIVLFKHMRIGGAVADDQYVFIAAESRGPVILEQSGYIVRVSLATGEVERLTGMLDAPARIAVHGDRVYFMLQEDPGVWSVPKKGGAVTKVVSGAPHDPAHGEESLGLWAEECGLVWLHGNASDPATLQFMSWN